MHTRLTSNAPHSSGRRAASSASNLRSSKRGVLSTDEEEEHVLTIALTFKFSVRGKNKK